MATDLSETPPVTSIAPSTGFTAPPVQQTKAPPPPIQHDVDSGVPAPDRDVTPARATPRGVNVVV